MRADARRLTPVTLTFLLVSALSSAGTGLVYPLAAIYLSRGRHLSLSVASGYFVALAIAGIGVSLVAGVLVDRLGPKAVSGAGTMVEGIGLCLFASAKTPAPVVLAGVLIGAGNGAFFTALTPLLASYESGPALNRAFAFRYWTINVASGVGLLVGAVAALQLQDSGYAVLFLVNGLTSCVFAAVTVFLPTPNAPAATSVGLRIGGFARDRRFLTLLVAHTLVATFGFALFESVVPATLVLGSGGSAAVANGMVLASILAIAALQLPVSRWTRDVRRTLLLTVHAGIWTLANLLGLALSTFGDRPWLTATVFGLVFGLGECFYAVAFQSLVVELVPPPILGQCNGLVSLLQGVGLAVGPPLGFWIVGTRQGAALWLVMAAVTALTAVLWRFANPVHPRTLAAQTAGGGG